MPATDEHTPDSLLRYLPAIYRQPDEQGEHFLRDLLAAFEKVLFGRADAVSIPDDWPALGHRRGTPVRFESLEELIGGISALFDPLGPESNRDASTRDEFLPWLAQWTALSLRADLDPEHQRKFIARAISLYARRGTKGNLDELLGIFTFGARKIDDEKAPHHFSVTLSLTNPGEDPKNQTERILRRMAIASALVDLEKPAHTSYDIKFTDYASMEIGRVSTIGVDTLLG